MRGVSWRARLALFWANPRWIIAISVLGALIAIASGREAKLSPAQVWLSVFVSLAVGLPAVLLTKRLIKRDIQSYAEFSLGITLRSVGFRTWKAHWKSIIAVLPVILAMGVSAVLARYLALPYLPILGMLIILSLLGYPEQEEVYRAMKAKLAEMEKKSPVTSDQ